MDLQDSLYRQQPVEKVQARADKQATEEQFLNQLKKGVEDEIKDKTAQEAQQGAEPRVTDREKRDREFREKKRRAREKKEAAEKRHPPRDGESLIDIQA